MAPAVGKNKTVDVALHYKAVHAPLQAFVKSVKVQSGPRAPYYLSKFADCGRERALSLMEDT